MSTNPESPKGFLKKILSMGTVVSMPSSSTEQMNRGTASAIEELRAIGLGSCGTVFEVPTTELAYKKGPDVKAIGKDFNLTNKVHNAIFETRSLLEEAFETLTIPQTPMCHEFMVPDSTAWWNTNLQRFPRPHRNNGAVFLVDRILPLPGSPRSSYQAVLR
ncbi:hypothetical protein MMC14_003690 [Varicellaria rhodocarpa]|nr:hypothetical protein [Varicellaria rhodocarpa]